MRRPAFAFLLTTGLGCGTEPPHLSSSYSVSAIEGVPPPRFVGATVECDISVTGGHLTFGPAEQFELGLDVLTDCSRAGGTPSQSTYGYTGTRLVDGLRVTFETARGGAPYVFEGQLVSSGELDVVVPLLVPTVDEVSVRYRPD